MGEAEKPVGQGAVRARRSEDSDPKQFKNSPARQDDTNRKAAAESTHQRQGRVSGDTYKRPIRQSAGSENSFERSPLHNQARMAGRGNGDQSPSWEGKGVYKNSQGTPGRSRLRPNTRGDESPDRGAAVPKFGEWDENNPASADGYTHIFNKVREERNSGAKTPGMTSPAPYYAQKPSTNDSVKVYELLLPLGEKMKSSNKLRMMRWIMGGNL
ncbi:hypothetical protein JRO89_XS01G0047700 [Xanthoceras sorbifolium]|uniref:RIN4 pathogenic type III effector avirulence factor Avr cleavage site domain-containing protein n=1 Tax=Xanthoceras sorbifolium TaxID=99658 RepID=A0ABQ8II81_9ROSI|nr:hypothetical protein JRO89_XS01G0047700 [Xanthoceras sorbifolium]